MKLNAESYLQTGSNELRVLEYRSGGMAFGINILKVNKIVNNLNGIVQVPESHPAVRGVFRDMDRLVPVIDLSRYLALPPTDDKKFKVIVTEFFGLLTGFLVERVDWIHHFGWEDVIDAERVFSGIDNRYVIGLVKPDGERMVQLLDYETILLDLCPHLGANVAMSYDGNANFDGRRVLIAEDSPAVRTMLETELLRLGFDVVAMCDGVDAWHAYEQSPFDLVISDVEMPRMDGLALTLNIRGSERPETPVIVYSSIGDVGMKSRAKFLKADAHITKLNLHKLIETAKALIEGRRVETATNETAEPASAFVDID